MSLVFSPTESGLRQPRKHARHFLSGITGTAISQEGNAIAFESGSFPMTGLVHADARLGSLPRTTSIRSDVRVDALPITGSIRLDTMSGSLAVKGSIRSGITTGTYRSGTEETFVCYTMSMNEVARSMAIQTAATLSPRLHQRIRTLAGLGPKWDGKRAEAVKSSVLADVVETVRRLKWNIGKSFHEPSLVPTFDGFVQIEWHEAKRSLDLEAVAEGWVAVGTSKEMQGENQYFEAEFERSNFDKIEKLYLWVAGSELIWPLQ
ncbi:MAG TPA: hypothetical protein VG938_15535 [Verrucomicrobiae bacterium]|jgi:hypothetical protein|nr:hypothetical protein [Verrucomicrobiae bacterium]